MSKQHASMFVIGGDPTLTEYLEVALERGYELRGVITDHPRVRAWATKKGIPSHPTDDYLGALKEQSFDYLFAITHLRLIPDEALALPAKGAINIHGGPLPRYAGLNSPSWGLMDGVEEYGVTWHHMVADTDQGDILEQRMFPVVARETSLSLNTKCFQAAVDSFGDLLEQLSKGEVPTRKQDLSQFSYFGRHDRPPAACVLDLRRPAVELDRLVRALHFGRNENLLGSAKLGHGDAWVVVRRAEVREASEAPGTVVSADDDSLVVTCSEGALAILEVGDLDGSDLTLGEAVTRLGLSSGGTLAPLDEAGADQLTQVNANLCRREPYWAKRLAGLDPVEAPHATDRPAEDAPNFQRLPVTIPAALSTGKTDFATAMTGAFAAFLARIHDRTAFDLGFQDERLIQEVGPAASLVSPRVPLRIDVDLTADFDAFLGQLTPTLADLSQRRTWLRDAIGRFPDLRGRASAIETSLRQVQVIRTSNAAGLEPAPGTVLALVVGDGEAQLVHDSQALAADGAAAVARTFQTFLESLAPAQAGTPLANLDILGDERATVIEQWNATATEYPSDQCIHQLIEKQTDATPDAPALAFEGKELTYRELDERANAFAHHLRTLGVKPGTLVGVCVERSLDLMVATLGIMKAGGAYLPLDPTYPRDRLALMIEDSKVPVIVSQAALVSTLPPHQAKVVQIDAEWDQIGAGSTARPEGGATATDLAYVIYTSGSTGRPKGVLVEHRNAVNFFWGMDDRIEHDPPGTWLAVTSLSFDISVLELFWTLARGFKVVMYRDRERGAKSPTVSQNAKPMDFTMFYFASGGGEAGRDQYKLMLEGAKFADTHGFTAVWTPERHFHDFGGIYPNPAVTGAAMAAVTENVQIRAGSVVLPLNHPIRVAEGWSVVDNLSNGRVGISFASGWQPNDFVLRPENYKDAKEIMFRDIEVVRKLWRGDSVSLPGPKDEDVEVKIFPRPCQKELPYWVTTAGNLDTFKRAGKIGANLLTHLLGQSIDEIAPKIEAYREARKEAGFDPDTGIVTLMLHTFVGETDEKVKDIVREPLKGYLGTSLSLLKKHAHTFFAAFTREGAEETGDILENITDEERAAILDHAFERYFEESGLFGRPERCVAIVDRLKEIGVNELGCLTDFGVDVDTVLANLPHLDRLRQLCNPEPAETADEEDVTGGISLPAQILEYGITHLQCTPSMARMLTLMEDGSKALASVKHMMVGGEAFPIPLAQELFDLAPHAHVTNMYGPTETTIWSSTHRLTGPQGPIPIGKPIANTALYVLDSRGQPVPAGVAGELFIGGDGVVRGYMNREELTRERFLPDPFREGGRMYRTGDVVRWRRDGVLEFMGRTDHQLKVHGHRIEPGEIEAHLAKHEQVQEAVVITHENSPGDMRLVAYVTPDGETPSAASMRELLEASLPDYMVPAHFVILDALPLTPNGKVDRKQLPAPEAEVTRAETDYVAPRNDTESQLVKLWQDTLGLDSVGIDDNFFDIGGHSLLVVSLHRKIRSTVEEPVTLTDLYRFPTIRALTAHLSGEGNSDAMQKSTARAEQRKAAARRRRDRRPRA